MMPSFARKDITTPQVVSSYHCIARCVRRAFLCGIDPYTGKDYSHRKEWVRSRLRELNQVFAIDIGTYAIMSNHIHLNLRVRPDIVEKWTDEEVVDRWWALFPRKIKDEFPETAPAELVEKWLNDVEWLAERRERLCSISWFMRCLCEHIARKANKEDDVTGRFWEGRFLSQALLDETALLAASIYIDLNPVRASIASGLETSDYTSIQDRIRKHIISNSEPDFLAEIKDAYNALEDETPFLLMDEKDYIEVVDWYGRMKSRKKAGFIKEDRPSILDRIGFKNKDDPMWLNQLFSTSSWAVGKANKMRDKALQTQRKWIQGTRIANAVLG